MTGTAFLPVVLVQFADNPAEPVLHQPADYEAMLFQKAYPYGAGSMRDYYLDQSGGMFDVTGEVSPTWHTMPRSYSTYVGTSYGYQTTEPNVWTLVRDAVAAADPTMDFCDADTDGDGLVDSLFVVHAGPGAEETRSGLWSIQWSLPVPVTTSDVCQNGRAVKVRRFTIEPEEFAREGLSAPGAPARLISIGVFVHEFGHVLGLPDLYDTDYSSPGGVGPWDVMASGTYGFYGTRPWRPTPMSAWSKLFLGWATAQNVTSDQLRTQIRSSDAARTGAFTGVYRLAPAGSTSATEYFLVENRDPSGWAVEFPTSGLAVWHVSSAVRNNSDDSHRLVSLIQADGLNELGTPGSGALGDDGDLFPGRSGRTTIDDQTIPSTILYTGVASRISIANIGAPGPTTTADLVISGQAPPPVEDEPPPPAQPTPTATPSLPALPTPTLPPLPTPSTTPTLPIVLPSERPLIEPTDRPVPVDVDPPDVTNVVDVPDPFTPNGDGRRDFIELHFSLSENSLITIKIYNRRGRVVKTILKSTPRARGATAVVWGGRNEKKRRVGPGLYKYRIKARDGSGNKGSPAVGRFRLRRA